MIFLKMRSPMKTGSHIEKDTSGPLAKAIAQQSAEWLESTYPSVYDALQQELLSGHSIDDVRQILRRIFGYDVREAFVLRVLQAAEHICVEQIKPAK